MSSKTRQMKDFNRKLIKDHKNLAKTKDVRVLFVPFFLINKSKDLIFAKYQSVISTAKEKYTEVLNSIDVMVSKMKLKNSMHHHNVSEISDTKKTDIESVRPSAKV